MQGSANAFMPDANMLAALTGVGSPNLVDSSSLYNVGGTTTLNTRAGLFQKLTTGAGNTTLNTVAVGVPGAVLIVGIYNDAGGARTITLGANFRGTGNVVGTASKVINIAFVSDGTNWVELFRTAAIT